MSHQTLLGNILRHVFTQNSDFKGSDFLGASSSSCQVLRAQDCVCPARANLAHSTHTLSPLSLQRISASELAPGLQHFGCSIHGQLDLNEDGLVDLAVGALGNAVVLWLVPLLSLTGGLSWVN